MSICDETGIKCGLVNDMTGVCGSFEFSLPELLGQDRDQKIAQDISIWLHSFTMSENTLEELVSRKCPRLNPNGESLEKVQEDLMTLVGDLEKQGANVLRSTRAWMRGINLYEYLDEKFE